jgi:hypothetical protein
MDDVTMIRSAERSRRSMLQNLALIASGAAVLSATASGHRATAAQTKVAQKLVAYQDTPKGALRCDNCSKFEAPSSCQVVEGSIAAAGWCKVYTKKQA